MVTDYILELNDFAKKAESTIQLFEKMTETFGTGKGIELKQFEREYLKVSIMAACLDAHHNGFRNGQHSPVKEEEQ